MSHLQSNDQRQINLVNQLGRIQYQYPKVQQTIVFYDLYDTPQADALYLQNLHTLAQVLIDSSTKVDIEKVKKGKSRFLDKLTISPDQTERTKIKKTAFELDISAPGQPPLLTNIFLYEKEKGQTRVVVIPIQKDLCDISKLKQQQEDLQNENIAKDKEFRDKGLQGDQFKKAQAEWKKEKDAKFMKSCVYAKDKHLKMFKIEAFLAAVLEKTETYSICSAIDEGMRRHKTITKYLEQEFNKIFIVPKETSPQFIFYLDCPSEPSEHSSEDLVTTRFDQVEDKFTIGKMDCWNPKYFYKPENVRTKIYQNIQKCDNKAISKIIQDFVDDWTTITVNTASCVATVLKLINQNLNKQKNYSIPEPNSSTDLNSSVSDIPNIRTFSEVFQQYIPEGLWFIEKEEYKLNEFYTDSRLGKKIIIEQGYPKIPSSIECLVFVHFFYKIVSDFSVKLKKTETQSKNDQIVLLNQWKKNLKQLYELVNSVNKTFLLNSENKDYHCKNMQRFFDFLMFTFDSCEKIKKITGRDISTSSSLKALFDQFKPKKDRLLSFIIANERSIRSDQPIHYYDLYLLIIKQNASQEIQSDLEYIQLHIHELKAFRIATQYIWDNQKLVEAIKSYALICLKYEKLNENRRKLISILDIERRMARLLKIIGQEQLAAEIYFKNRQLHFAHNCSKQVLSKYKGDEKSSILVKWGERFEKDFEFDLANSYYLQAYSYARSPAEKKKAVSHKLKLQEKRIRMFTEEQISKYDKFIKDEATEESLIEFCSETKLGEMHKKIIKYLTWDKLVGCSTIAKNINAEVDPELSILASEGSIEKSMEVVKA